ncbi:hypothetical protein FKP32DRAFT_1685886 [Trametes sanguinea]|nr:hypothetical protein FKP32DRAFT_1685886 [Trametes sanguinea]
MSNQAAYEGMMTSVLVVAVVCRLGLFVGSIPSLCHRHVAAIVPALALAFSLEDTRRNRACGLRGGPRGRGGEVTDVATLNWFEFAALARRVFGVDWGDALVHGQSAGHDDDNLIHNDIDGDSDSPGDPLAAAHLSPGPFKPRPWISSKQFLSTPPLSTETPMMRDVKAYPYPTNAPDSALFEDTTPEYHEAALDTHAAAELYPVAGDAGEPGSLLKQLIRSGRLADATRVREELVNIGVEIPLHPVYHFAARQAVRDPDLSQRERMEAVLSWWSLFPPKSSGFNDLKRSIHSMLAELLRNDIAPDIPLLVSWSLLAASKGFAGPVRNDVIPVVARYAPAQTFKTFLERFCAASRDYQTALVDSGSVSKKEAAKLISTELSLCYSLAIQELLQAGKVHAAWDVLGAARSLHIHVWYSIVKEATEKMEKGNALENAVPRPKKSPLNACAKRDSPALVSSMSISPQDLEVVSHLELNATGALVRAARSLKRALQSGSLDIPASRLSEIIRGFLAIGRIALVRRLRTIAYRHEDQVSLWALAEMTRLDSIHSSMYTIMKEFEAHFHVVGVPRDLFDTLWQERRMKTPSEVAQGRPPLRRKLPPSPHHTHFIWNAVIKRARTSSQVQRLYVQFLEDVAASREFPLDRIPYMASRGILEPTADPADYIRPVPPPCLFNARHFAPFMRAFVRLQLPSLATRVVVDMYALGIKPEHGEVFDAFISALPSPSSERTMVDVVRNVEKHLDRADRRRSRDGSSSLNDGEDSPNHSPANSLKTNVLAFVYAAALRGLLLNGQGVSMDAVEVARRFSQNAPYRPGAHAFVDEVLQDLSAAVAEAREAAKAET